METRERERKREKERERVALESERQDTKQRMDLLMAKGDEVLVQLDESKEECAELRSRSQTLASSGAQRRLHHNAFL